MQVNVEFASWYWYQCMHQTFGTVVLCVSANSPFVWFQYFSTSSIFPTGHKSLYNPIISQHPFWFQWQCSMRWRLLNHSHVYQKKISKKGWKGKKIQAWSSSCDGCLFTNMSFSATLAAGAVCKWWITGNAGALPRAAVRRAKQWECTRITLQARGTEPPNATKRRHSELSFIIQTAFKAYGCLLFLLYSFFSNVNACKRVLQTAHPSVRQSMWLSPSLWKNKVWQALVTLIKPLQGARKGALGFVLQKDLELIHKTQGFVSGRQHCL